MTIGGLDVKVMGRRPKRAGDAPLYGVTERALIAADLVLLQTERGTKPQVVKEMRNRHHALARSIAAGLSAIEISAIHGYSISRISILQTDPSFAELVHHYRGLDDEAFMRSEVDANVVANRLKIKALELVEEKIDEAPDEVTIGQALEVSKVMMDRTGQGVQTTNLNVNVGLADRLKNARQRSPVIDVFSRPARELGNTGHSKEPGA